MPHATTIGGSLLLLSSSLLLSSPSLGLLTAEEAQQLWLLHRLFQEHYLYFTVPPHYCHYNDHLCGDNNGRSNDVDDNDDNNNDDGEDDKIIIVLDMTHRLQRTFVELLSDGALAPAIIKGAIIRVPDNNCGNSYQLSLLPLSSSMVMNYVTKEEGAIDNNNEEEVMEGSKTRWRWWQHCWGGGVRTLGAPLRLCVRSPNGGGTPLQESNRHGFIL